MIEFICKICKYKFYSDENIKPIYYVLKLYNFQCPSCGSKFSKDPNIIIFENRI